MKKWSVRTIILDSSFQVLDNLWKYFNVSLILFYGLFNLLCNLSSWVKLHTSPARMLTL